jgi:hypothetical protein
MVASAVQPYLSGSMIPRAGSYRLKDSKIGLLFVLTSNLWRNERGCVRFCRCLLLAKLCCQHGRFPRSTGVFPGKSSSCPCAESDCELPQMCSEPSRDDHGVRRLPLAQLSRIFRFPPAPQYSPNPGVGRQIASMQSGTGNLPVLVGYQRSALQMRKARRQVVAENSHVGCSTQFNYMNPVSHGWRRHLD